MMQPVDRSSIDERKSVAIKFEPAGPGTAPRQKQAIASILAPMTDHHHHGDHDHSELSETELRVRALETILTEKGYVDPASLDLLIETYEIKVGPLRTIVPAC
jgi:nitrile hydratase subunit alpha